MEKYRSELERIMKKEFRIVFDFSRENKVSMRTAAFAIALQRIEKAL
ncbi:MAG: hypothetical protein V1717_03505 [Candidatus Micrarchaeota archaeon]